jgi:phage terminase Nu1 subunit (DNA packaging protein)
VPPRAQTIALEAIADAFGVSTETIRLWRKDGMPHRMQSGRPVFVLRECIRWRREQDRQTDTEPEAVSAKAEHALKVRAERLLRELELAERSRDLVPIGESGAFMEEFVAALAATAAGRLTRFERDIVRASTPADARRVTAAIHVALMEGMQEFADTVEAAGDADAPLMPVPEPKPTRSRAKRRKTK